MIRTATWLVLTLAPWPLWRLVIHDLRAYATDGRVWWRRVRRFLDPSGRPSKVMAVLGVQALGSGLLVTFAPEVALWVAAAVVVVALALLVRSRPSHGARRGLPPGRIRLMPIEPLKDRDFYLDQARRHGRVFKTGSAPDQRHLSLRPMVCVVDHHLALRLLREHDAALEVYPTFPFSWRFPRKILRNMETDDHEVYSRIFRRAFSAVDLDALEPAFADDIRLEIERMEAHISAAGLDEVAPLHFLRHLMFGVMARFLFGTGPDTAEFESLMGMYRDLGIESFDRISNRWHDDRALDELMDAVEQRARARVASRQADAPPSCLVEAIADLDEALLSDRAVLGNLIQMVDSSRDTAALMRWIMKDLDDHPDLLTRVGNGGAVDRSLAGRIVNESLRREQSEFLYRRVARDIDLDGHLLPKGWTVRVCVREAHLDPAVFDRPDCYDPDRFADRSYSMSEYAPFGMYRHVCLGAQLTRRVAAALVVLLATEYRLVVTGNGPLEFDEGHWSPNRSMRVRVIPGATAGLPSDHGETSTEQRS